MRPAEDFFTVRALLKQMARKKYNHKRLPTPVLVDSIKNFYFLIEILFHKRSYKKLLFVILTKIICLDLFNFIFTIKCCYSY